MRINQSSCLFKLLKLCLSKYSHEEITKTALIRSRGAHKIIEVGCERDAGARLGKDVYAVSLPVAVVAEVDACCCALGDGKVESRGGEGGGGEGEEDGGCELHCGRRSIAYTLLICDGSLFKALKVGDSTCVYFQFCCRQLRPSLYCLAIVPLRTRIAETCSFMSSSRSTNLTSHHLLIAIRSSTYQAQYLQCCIACIACYQSPNEAMFRPIPRFLLISRSAN